MLINTYSVHFMYMLRCIYWQIRKYIETINKYKNISTLFMGTELSPTAWGRFPRQEDALRTIRAA